MRPTCNYPVNVTVDMEACLSKEEALRVAIQVIREASGFDEKSIYSIQEGKLVVTEHSTGGSHAWTTTKEVREATDFDKATLIVLGKLKG